MRRMFILKEPLHFQSMLAALTANWKTMADMGQPLGVHVAPYKRSRSDEQNALMWVWLTQVKEQAWVNGQQFDEETWHEHYKREFLPEVNARGDHKWRYLPDGTRQCIGSTTRLKTDEMSLYMQKLDTDIHATLGVIIQ